jgi:hypothetical protein
MGQPLNPSSVEGVSFEINDGDIWEPYHYNLMFNRKPAMEKEIHIYFAFSIPIR